MRFVIEVDEGQTPRISQAAMGATSAGAPFTGVQGASAGSTTDAGTANGGAPGAELFQALGVDAPPASATYFPSSAAALAAPGAGDAANGGAAPAWLWQGSAPSKPPTDETASTDGGSAPGA